MLNATKNGRAPTTVAHVGQGLHALQGFFGYHARKLPGNCDKIERLRRESEVLAMNFGHCKKYEKLGRGTNRLPAKGAVGR
jgi:hypothetical protein